MKSTEKELNEPLEQDEVRPIEKEINDLVNDIEFKIIKLVSTQINDNYGAFENIKKRISQNIGTLRLGLVQRIVEKFIKKILNKEFEKLKRINSMRLSSTRNDINEDLNQIFNGLKEYIKTNNKKEKNLKNEVAREYMEHMEP